ncbi:metal ABC transporter solute-binding protein, Zn/Mn family [Microbacterium immunditiarum]|uniref:Zinc/manganese transport system substrate-binding protein n=1 Tax=Microbacterium immunditiarum TaxID=337480 RepID=A0A7Y9KK41_9MICO|nr:zinc ABC transporter substrate-binding protein [Microbacterium immunditiarum]NYE18444.1 zinc/manganese transport system substrate-binding protein [Microbacterium immunditiarum]
MRTDRRLLAVAGVAAASVLVLAGCASSGAGTSDGRITVVASTDVYGQIVEEIGGDLVDVTSIVSSASGDPHSFEPSARDQLAVSHAQLVIENGGGYDSFVDSLVEASSSDAKVLTAVEFSSAWEGGAARDDSDEHADEGDHGHDHEHIEGFNEHVWYDVRAMADLAIGIASELEVLDPDNGEVFQANAESFTGEIERIEAQLADIEAADGGAGLFVTEPVPLYLVEAAGLVDLTPDAFSEAVEEGQDVPPATLLEALDLIGGGDVRVVIANTQTGGAETTRVVQEADARGVPVVEFSETLPEGQAYLSWMQANATALAEALAA